MMKATIFAGGLVLAGVCFAGALAVPAIAHGPNPDIPLVAIGLPFAPETPKPVSPDHPLYHRVAVSEIEAMPGSVRFSTARPSTINDGLRDTLKLMNLLAPTDAEARVRLVAHWGGMAVPSKFMARTKQVTTTIGYRLTRIDSGAVLFDRQIETTVDERGAGLDGGMGAARAATAVNFASMAACIDKAAYGRAPDNCALTPKFSVSVSRY